MLVNPANIQPHTHKSGGEFAHCFADEPYHQRTKNKHAQAQLFSLSNIGVEATERITG